MSRHLPHRALMTTFLADTLSARRITIEHLADLLAPTPDAVIRSWVEGSATPLPDDLLPLATALHVHPVEMVVGWLIDQSPEIERVVRPFTLDLIDSSFPRSTDLDLRAPRTGLNMTVPDPHDEHDPGTAVMSPLRGPLRKQASGADRL